MSASAPSISAKTRMAELLRVENLSAGYGEARVIHGVSFALEDGQSLALLGRNGVGKTTLIDSLIGVTTRFGGTDRACRRGHRASSAVSPRAARRWLDAAGAQHLPLADRRRKSDRSRDCRALDGRARLRALSPPRGAARANGPAIVGRGAADAGHRPRAGPQSAPLAARRADRGPRARSSSTNCWRLCANSAARACR